MNDVKGYIEKLDKSMTRQEKFFFLNKVKLQDYDFIVDFGCANGRLLYEVDTQLKGKAKMLRLYGVDNSVDISVDYEFTHQFTRRKSLDELPLIVMKDKKVLLILSSVLHEVDNDTLGQIELFIKMYADTVVIRDMHLNASNRVMRKERRKAQYFAQNSMSLLTPEQHRLFNDIYKYDNDNSVKQLYEYFLKYTYVKNWATEKNEKYFGRNGSNIGHLLQLLSPQEFYVKYSKHYILPYKKKQVYKDFGYKLRANTHVKVIIQRKKEKSIKYTKRQLRK